MSITYIPMHIMDIGTVLSSISLTLEMSRMTKNVMQRTVTMYIEP